MYIDFWWGKLKMALGRLRIKWEDNIHMDLDEIDSMDGRWLELTQDHVQWCALVLAVLNLGVLL
jgi:hypothetical protein